jgi:hypothetical protein
MFHISVLGVILLSQGLKTVEIISNISHTFCVIIKDVTESRKKPENALMEIFKKVLFCTFFFSDCQGVILHKVSTVKNAKKCTQCIFSMGSKTFFT